MSELQSVGASPATAGTAVVETPAIHVAIPPTAQPAAGAAPADTNAEPHWLAARLERERLQVLKSLGVESVDDAKKAIADLKQKQDAEKSAEQRAIETAQKLAAIEAEKASMASALGLHAKTQLAGLSEAQRTAVVAIAGDDPARQLTTIAALASTWSQAPSAAAPIAVADTAPAPSAPVQTATSPPDHRAVYEELKKTNPVIAARYAMANGVHNQ